MDQFKDQRKLGSRARLIAAIKTPIQLLALVLIVAEGFLLLLMKDASPQNKDLLFRVMVGIVVGIVATISVVILLRSIATAESHYNSEDESHRAARPPQPFLKTRTAFVFAITACHFAIGWVAIQISCTSSWVIVNPDGPLHRGIAPILIWPIAFVFTAPAFTIAIAISIAMFVAASESNDAGGCAVCVVIGLLAATGTLQMMSDEISSLLARAAFENIPKSIAELSTNQKSQANLGRLCSLVGLLMNCALIWLIAVLRERRSG
jgi:hypothetical protein